MGEMAMDAIDAHNLVRRFGAVTAVEDVSLTVLALRGRVRRR